MPPKGKSSLPHLKELELLHNDFFRGYDSKRIYLPQFYIPDFKNCSTIQNKKKF